MGVIRTIYKNRDEWLEARNSGIGASEIASVLGCGYSTPIQLWKEKIGAVQRKNLSDNERVKFGNDAEDALRSLFRVMHPEYTLEFEPFTVLRQEGEFGFLFDTPDGWLVENATGKRGLYESKTATLLSRSDSDRWWQKIPDNYFAQISQGIYCGDYDFAVLFALLRDRDGDAQIRAYRFEREECEWKIDEIKREGKRFWNHVLNGTMPSAPLIL